MNWKQCPCWKNWKVMQMHHSNYFNVGVLAWRIVTRLTPSWYIIWSASNWHRHLGSKWMHVLNFGSLFILCLLQTPFSWISFAREIISQPNCSVFPPRLWRPNTASCCSGHFWWSNIQIKAWENTRPGTPDVDTMAVFRNTYQTGAQRNSSQYWIQTGS